MKTLTAYILRVAEIKVFYQNGIEFLKKGIASDFGKKVIETFGTRVFLIAIGLVTSVVIPRILGPAGMGLYATAMAVSDIGIQFGNMGLYASNVYFVGRDRNLLPALTGNSLFFSFAVIGMLALTAGCISAYWVNMLPVGGSLLVFAMATIPVGVAFMLLQHLLLGIQSIRSFNVVELVTKLSTVAILAFLIVLNLVTVESVYAVNLAVMIASCVWIYHNLRKHSSIAPRPVLSLLKGHILYSAKIYVSWLFSFLVLRSDILLTQYYLGTEQTGFYAIAVTLANLLYMLPTVIGTILFPKLSTLDNDADKIKLTLKIAKIVFFMMAGIGMCAAIGAGPALQLLYGKTYLPSLPAFLWLIPGIIMLSVNTIFMNYFSSTGMPTVALYSPAVAAILNIFLNIKLLPTLGIIGASISSTIAYGTMLCLSLLFIKKTYR
jgi:O-antigen/teichoic acid export membrane protein